MQALESGQFGQLSQWAQLEALRGDLVRWAALWGLPRMGEELRLRVSTRMRRSLGSYRAARDEIALAVWLFEAPPTQTAPTNHATCSRSSKVPPLRSPNVTPSAVASWVAG